jgi:signal peptidase I
MIRYLFTIILSCGISVTTAAAQKSYTVSGDSMSPALITGDTVVVDDTDSNKKLQRGDMVAIRISTDSTAMVKRIVAVAGDRVDFKDGAVCVNGEKSGEFDAKRWLTPIKQLERCNSIVPAGSLFVLGDNASNSRDSKRLGLISTSQVEGKVIRVIKKTDK